jgi:hypothetical protein
VSCAGSNCTFDATDGFASYVWNFGDGEGGTGDPVLHQYPAKGGSYTVTLTVPGASAVRTVSCNPKKGCR